MVIPAAIRRELERHADEEAPNEACGLIALRAGHAERYVPCVNTAASPYRFDLRVPDPELIFELEEHGFELAVFHSHPTDSARPSKTDLANIGLWEDRPYLILSRPTRELCAWTIRGEAVERLPLESAEAESS